MTDTVDRATRSRIMARIRSKNTNPERFLRAAFVRAGLRGWRMWARDLPGTPDFVFDAARVAVFVDSPFWHGFGAVPKDPAGHWAAKLGRNRERFALSRAQLRAAGWQVVEVLEGEALHLPGAVARAIARAFLAGPLPGVPHRVSTAATGPH